MKTLLVHTTRNMGYFVLKKIKDEISSRKQDFGKMTLKTVLKKSVVCSYFKHFLCFLNLQRIRLASTHNFLHLYKFTLGEVRKPQNSPEEMENLQVQTIPP